MYKCSHGSENSHPGGIKIKYAQKEIEGTSAMTK